MTRKRLLAKPTLFDVVTNTCGRRLSYIGYTASELATIAIPMAFDQARDYTRLQAHQGTQLSVLPVVVTIIITASDQLQLFPGDNASCMARARRLAAAGHDA